MRFLWIYKYGIIGAACDPNRTHVVLDTEPPGGEPGGVQIIAEAPNRAAAMMLCMSLNGSAQQADPSTR